MSQVFISHSHRDAALAAEFQKFVEKISSRRLSVERSSKKGSIEYGESWIDWIHERVQESVITFVLLTPSSFSAKWVLWEAGAVDGVKRAGNANDEAIARRVIPIQFQIDPSEDMGPFQATQVADGLDRDAMVEMAKSVLRDFRGSVIDGVLVDDELANLKETCTGFVEGAKSTLDDLQISQRDDLVLEWVARIDKALEARDYAITHSYRRWINTAFLGKGGADEATAIDFRIHVRLAEGFRKLDQWRDARQQLVLARALSPRDMMILRQLGRIELELGNTKPANDILDEMLLLDPQIFSEDEESLNLKVRILIESEDWPGAHELLREATELAKRSTYVANMRAIATMKVKGAKEAEHYFEELRNGEQGTNKWALGNLVNAALGLGDTGAADALLAQLKSDRDARESKDSIARYFDEISALRKRHDASFDYDWRAHWP